MRADVICEIKSPTFPSSARARNGLRMSQCSPLFSNSISPAGVFNVMRRTCAVAPSFNFLIAILNNDAINLVSIKIDHVLRLPLCLLSARPLHFEKPEISEASEGNERQDEGIPPVHTRPAVATTPWFRLPRELTV